MPKIIFTGGGTAGHVTLNLNLIPLFLKNNFEVVYIGSKNGIEEELVKQFPNVRYLSIPTGKLRRYFSYKNLSDMIKIPLGCLKATYLIHKENPDIIFSKGGFVSFPVVVGGFLNRKKIFMHESDFTPGLANKLSLPFVTTFFTTFEETIKAVKQQNKVRCIGPVMSNRLKDGNKEEGAKFANLQENKPTILFVGGSLGAKSLNTAVETNLKALLKNYQVIHITGKSGFNPRLKAKGYAQFEYVDKELKHLYALADLVISRAGSNAIFELALLQKPMILVPLPNTSSRGEQSLNAQSFKKKGFADIITDENVANPEILLPAIKEALNKKVKTIENLKNNPPKTSTPEELFRLITDKK